MQLPNGLVGIPGPNVGIGPIQHASDIGIDSGGFWETFNGMDAVNDSIGRTCRLEEVD